MWRVLGLLGLALMGCGEDPETPVDTGEAPLTAPEIRAGGCGLDGYDWQPFDQVGTIVSWERATELELSAAAIKGSLGAAGLPTDLLPIAYDVRTYRVRYTTQDRGEVVEATALISYPEGVGDVPTLLWTHGTTGFTNECAPSGAGIEGAGFNLLFASLGVAVVAPDYLGMNGFGEPAEEVHPYIIAEPTAVASLDAVRAAWALQEADGSITSPGTTQTVLMGASEGGFAALWADRYAPHYLPEADVVGVVASVPPADVEGLTRHGIETFGPTTEAMSAAITTWHSWYGMDMPLSDVLQSEIADALPDLLLEECNPGDAFSDLDAVDGVFTQPFIDAVLAEDTSAFPDLACATAQSTLVKSDIPHTSTAPVMYVVAELDDLVAAGPTRDAFGPLCEAGYAMTYLECAGADHVEGAVWSLAEQWDWVLDRLAGTPLTDSCVQGPAVTCSLEDVL